jgi:preprotein translocase subunit SecD
VISSHGLRPLALLAALGCALAVWACGGGGQDDSGTADSGSTAPSSEPASEPTRVGIYDWEQNVVPNPSVPKQRGVKTPFESQGDAQAFADRAPACEQDGCIVVSEQPPFHIAGEKDARSLDYYVVRDRPELTPADIRDPQAGPDPVTQQPSIVFRFSKSGQARFEAMTNRIADRAKRTAPPGATENEVEVVAGHFAVIADDKVVARPVVDYFSYPDGLDGSHGIALSGDFDENGAQAIVGFLEANGGQ